MGAKQDSPIESGKSSQKVCLDNSNKVVSEHFAQFLIEQGHDVRIGELDLMKLIARSEDEALDYRYVFSYSQQFDSIELSELEKLNSLFKDAGTSLVILSNEHNPRVREKLVGLDSIKLMSTPINYRFVGQEISNSEAQRKSDSSVESQQRQKISFKDLNVLVAEDNEINRMVVKKLLNKFDIEPTIVEDGAQAVTAFKDGSFDLILMDCEMPTMDGFEATRAIRNIEKDSNKSKTPIFALTAHTMKEHQYAVRDAGMDFHLAKPVTLDSLRKAILKFGLDRH